MYKVSKSLVVLLLLFVIATSCFAPRVFAEEDTNTVENEIVEEELERPSELLNTTAPTTYKTSTVNNISALPQANLNLNNILSFILIGIGLVIIILGIAILISSKRM